MGRPWLLPLARASCGSNLPAEQRAKEPWKGFLQFTSARTGHQMGASFSASMAALSVPQPEHPPPPQSGMAPQPAATVKSSFRCHSGSKETQIPEDPCQTHRGASTQGCGHSSLPWHIQEADRLYNLYKCPASPPTTMIITLLSMDEPSAGKGMDQCAIHFLRESW